MDHMVFFKMEFSKWELPESHDIFAGNDGLCCNPQNNWRSQLIGIAASTQLTEVDGPTFLKHQKHGAYANILQA